MSRRKQLFVQRVSHTVFEPPQRPPWDDDESLPERIFEPRGDESPGRNQSLMEFAGRGCYLSFDRPNPATADNADYLAHIIDSAHLSVIEHSSVGMWIEGVSRSLTHELVRHRHFAYSQLSQRFVPPSKMGFVVPPAVRDDLDMIELMENSFEDSVQKYAFVLDVLKGSGRYTNKQIREASRALLPNMTETRLTITGNYRSWLEFIQKRDSDAADAEIQELAGICGSILAVTAPAIFGHEARSKWHERLAHEPTTR